MSQQIQYNPDRFEPGRIFVNGKPVEVDEQTVYQQVDADMWIEAKIYRTHDYAPKTYIKANETYMRIGPKPGGKWESTKTLTNAHTLHLVEDSAVYNTTPPHVAPRQNAFTEHVKHTRYSIPGRD